MGPDGVFLGASGGMLRWRSVVIDLGWGVALLDPEIVILTVWRLKALWLKDQSIINLRMN